MVENKLQEAIEVLEEEIAWLKRLARESESGGWSTHQVKPMRSRAVYLQNKVYKLKSKST